MKKTFTINGKEVEFTDCTAISCDFPEAGRQRGVYVHDLDDEFCDGNGVIFNDFTCPEDADEAEAMLVNEYLDTDCDTLDTVEMEA